MAWLEIHQALREHRKVLALADSLGILETEAVGHLLYLWLWALDNAGDGTLPDSERIIARAAAWPKSPATFSQALQSTGWLDQEDGRLVIHDWQEYAGRLLAQRQEKRRKMRVQRAAQGQKRTGSDPEACRNGDGTERADGANADGSVPAVQNTTLQNSTEQNLKGSKDLVGGAPTEGSEEPPDGPDDGPGEKPEKPEEPKEEPKEEPPGPSPRDLVERYHQLCPSLPVCRKLEGARREVLRRRLKDTPYGDLEEVFIRAEASDFLAGREKRWRADLDWLMKPENILHVLEGRYNNRAVTTLPQKTTNVDRALSLVRQFEAEEALL